MNNIKPLSNRVVLEKFTDEEKVSSGGIIIPKSSSDNIKKSKVISAGDDVDFVKKGDTVLYNKNSCTHIDVDNQDYLMIREPDIIAIV